MENKITGAEALLRGLLQEGVTTIFGYPGGAILPVYDKLYDYSDRLHHILVRHEQGAIHAAQGYARTSGSTGVVIVTSGPGATNVITGLCDAMIDSTPLVVISGQVGAQYLGSDAFQETDFVAMTQSITKWAFQVRRAEDVPSAIARAFYIARSGRPGPVVLDIAKDAQIGLLDWHYEPLTYIRSYDPDPQVDATAVAQAADLINNAARPLILVGQGVAISGACDELKRFAERIDAPVAATLLGLSCFPSVHRLYKGMLGMHGNIGPNWATNQADVIVAIGMRFDDRVTGNTEHYARQARIVHIDIDNSEFDKTVHADVAIHADARQALLALLPRVHRSKHTEWIEKLDKCNAVERREVIDREMHHTGSKLTMGEVVAAVSAASGSRAIAVTDVGQNQIFATRYFKYHHKRSICTSGGLGTMGYGMPAAIGATFGAPGRMVCCFMGDGGFQMCIEELGKIMEQQAPVKMILMNNHYLGNVRQWQDMFWHRRQSFTKMMNPCYELIAQGYGIPYEAVTDRARLAQAIKKMAETDGPYILECAILEDDNVLPMTPPGLSVDDMMLDVQV